MEWRGLDISGSEWEHVAGFCEHGNELSASRERMGFLDSLKIC
jgi:hypothetical protein